MKIDDYKSWLECRGRCHDRSSNSDMLGTRCVVVVVVVDRYVAYLGTYLLTS